MKIAVTGHRPNKLGGEYDIVDISKLPEIHWLPNRVYTDHIRVQLQDVIDSLNPDLMISGLALGIDTIWALLAIENNIALMAAVPFPSQAKVWPMRSQILYNFILEYAKKTGGVKTTGTDPYEKWKMDTRNEYMVNNCDLLVAVYNGDKSGGTFNCKTYAESISKPILIINPNPTNNESTSEGYESNDNGFVKSS